MIALVYVRVSTAEQVAGGSLATQEADCRAWAAREGCQVVEVLRDEGESAKTVDRPRLLAALARVRSGGVDCFVVWKLDRLSRNATDGLAIRAELRRHGCRLVSATEATGDDPVGEMVGAVLLAVAQFDNAVRGQRARRGMQQAAQAGGWTHRPPIGYRLDRSGRIPTLRPDPATAPAIAAAFRGLADGTLTRQQATETLRAAGISPQAVSRILRAPVYGGLIEGALTRQAPVRAAFAGIVDADVFQAVQARLRHPEQIPRGSRRRELPLAGVARCGECGRPIQGGISAGRGGRRYGYYDCRRGHVRVRIEAVHAALEAMLSADLAAPILDLRALVAREASAEADVGRLERDAARARQSQAEARLARLADGYADGVIDEATYRTRATQYRQDAARAGLDAEAAQIGVDGMLARLDEIAAVLRDPAALWARLDAAGRRTFADHLLGGLILTPDGLTRRNAQTPAIAGVYGEERAGIRDGVPSWGVVETARRLIEALASLLLAA